MTPRFGWIPDLPDHRDHRFAYRPRFADPRLLPARLDWSATIPRYPKVSDQNGSSACVGYSLARAYWLRELMPGQDVPQPSAPFIYWNARRTGGYTGDNGCQIRDALKTVLLDGVCDYSDWPLNMTFINTAPFEGCYRFARQHLALAYRRVNNTSLLDLLSALVDGPVVGGLSIFTSFLQARNGDAPMPAETDSLEGGHALCFTGFDQSTQRLLFDNSWGQTWGNRGRGTVPFQYVTTASLADDFWLLEKVT